MTHAIRILIVAIAVLAPLPAAAQKTTFDPTMSLNVGYTDNLAFAGTGSSSDYAWVLRATLPVTRDWRTTSLNFQYSPSIVRYSDQDALDRTDHFARLGVQSSLSRKSSLGANLNFSRTQAQGTFTDINDPDIILTQRTDRDTFTGSLNYSRQIGKVWYWDVGAGAGETTFDTIAGFTGSGVEDRTYVRASTSAGRQISQKLSVGFNLGWQESRLDLSGEEEIRSVGAVVTRTIDQKSSLDATVGYFETESRIVGTPDRSGYNMQISYDRSFRRISLATYASHQPTSGGNLPGTATSTNLGISISGNQLVNWTWSVNAVGTNRDPADPTQSDIDSVGLGGNVTWRANNKLGMNLRSSWVRQDDNVPMSADIEVFRVALGVIWYIKG